MLTKEQEVQQLRARLDRLTSELGNSHNTVSLAEVGVLAAGGKCQLCSRRHSGILLYVLHTCLAAVGWLAGLLAEWLAGWLLVAAEQACRVTRRHRLCSALTQTPPPAPACLIVCLPMWVQHQQHSGKLEQDLLNCRGELAVEKSRCG